MLTNDGSPRKENPKLRITRLIPTEILCRRLGVFNMMLVAPGFD